jgi:1-acyl-sn-glycerol-3-phosphate acyltransferase
MVRTIIWFMYFGISLVFTLPEFWVAQRQARNGNDLEAKAIAVKKARSWSRQLIWLAGGKIEVVGEENIPKDEGYLVISNHQSNFDIPIILGYFGKPMAFIAKIETKKMMIVRDWMIYLKCLFLDRNDFRQSVKVINQGSKNLKEGHNYVIFPEGTRSEDGNLGDFKPGSVKMAKKAGAKILPITIDGSIKLMRKGEKLIKPGSVRVIIHKPVESDLESVQLMDHVKSIIEKGFDKR